MEGLHINLLFVTSKGGNCVSLDKLNEFLNLWNESCVTSLDFTVACDRSKHIIMMRKCACEAYGKSKSFSTKTNEDYE